ncbi:MAG: tetratricopeptide repeat protein, partial [Candidatus Cloacimonetes bacterium]|nr:tetratricopeptide repeat protein [Candidatus Cloacimonadota bacterium]
SFVNLSIIYIATIRYELNRSDEAFEMLRTFIMDNEKKDDHPKALIKLADLYLKDGNVPQALTFLSLLVDKYPKSPEATEAYLKTGKTYFENGNYSRSIEVLQHNNNKKHSRSLQHDAMYYIAYNYYYLKDYQKAYQTVKTLEKKELRADKITDLKILHARILSEMGNIKDAVTTLEKVIADNPRTNMAAEAAFYMGEIQFHKLLDYEAAIESYATVSRESARSDYTSKASAKSAVASQILQYYNDRNTMSSYQLITQQYRLAEYYLYELSLPDSALYIYENIPFQVEIISARIDSLQAQIDHYYLNRFEIESPAKENLDISSDSLYVEDDVPLEETVFDVDAIFAEVAALELDLENYYRELIPQSYLMCMVVNRQFLGNEPQVQFYYEKLLEEYRGSKFAEAAREFLIGEKVTFLTDVEKHQLNEYEEAMTYFLEGEDVYQEKIFYIISVLEPLVDSSISDLATQSLYTLGYIYYFDLCDTLYSKSYFDTLLVRSPDSEYAAHTRRFYKNGYYINLERSPFLIEEEIRVAAEEQERQNRLSAVEDEIDDRANDSFSEHIEESIFFEESEVDGYVDESLYEYIYHDPDVESGCENGLIDENSNFLLDSSNTEKEKLDEILINIDQNLRIGLE